MAVVTGTVVAGAKVYEARKARKQAQKQAQRVEKQVQKAEEKSASAFKQIRDPRDILLEAYGEEGYYGPEVTEAILGRERELMGPMLDLR